MASPLLEEIKQRIPISQLIGSHQRRMECRFCGSSTGLKIDHVSNFFKCYACDRYGDQVSWLMYENGWEAKRAIQELAEIAGVSLTPNKERQQILTSIARYCQEALRTHQVARSYLEGRGFTWEFMFQHSIGYFHADMTMDLVEKVGFERAYSVRFLRADGQAYYRDHIIIPVRGLNGAINNMQGRALFDTEPKYLALPKESSFGQNSLWSHLYNEHELQRCYITAPSSYVFLCEGVPDTWTLLQHDLHAVGIMGNSSIRLHAHKLKRLKQIFTILDNDKATNDKLLEQIFFLQLYCPNTEIRVVKIPQPPGADADKSLKIDVNAWFNHHGATVEELRELAHNSPTAIETLMLHWALDPDRHEYLFILLKSIPRDEHRLLWLDYMSQITGVPLAATIYAAGINAGLNFNFRKRSQA